MSKFFAQKRNARSKWTIQAALSAFGAAFVGASLLFSSLPAAAAAPAPIVPAAQAAPMTIDASMNEQVVMVPAMVGNTRAAELETTLFKPPGNGPFPLVIMNHGKALGNPRLQGRDRFVFLSREFVKRGYAVAIPMRKGFSQSTGEYVDRGCDMTAHGQTQADDLQSALEYFRAQPWVDKNSIVLAGQSYGGLTALAAGTRGLPGVKALINFAGGLRVHGGDCAWQSSLIKAFSEYGSHTSLPSLWFYGENDNHFSPELASRMYNAYQQAGGRARLIAFGPFKSDAHGMSGSRDGVRIWWPETERFLKEIGMPTDEMYALADDNRIPKTDYAAIDNIEAVPFLRDGGREQYKVFLSKSAPRAFAVSPTGAWSWAEDGDDPAEQVLATCQKNSSQPCKLYAVDNNVVWAPDTMTASGGKPANASGVTPKLTGP
ncbi:Dienelactone hydrolase [Noviherbaspirillum humi]|uniref:Dienelactone hydrolase n=1 Tax=Noviherbaspirillum humi TaxID=1688639 RepID=A0A239C776_9BURK|nr:CocE/NonD family hydrolase [Noviherbaspirillum humi]SNS15471.1 Dienelactone hydrolase [Noviherbaspirillum humi]